MARFMEQVGSKSKKVIVIMIQHSNTVRYQIIKKMSCCLGDTDSVEMASDLSVTQYEILWSVMMLIRGDVQFPWIYKL